MEIGKINKEDKVVKFVENHVRVHKDRMGLAIK